MGNSESRNPFLCPENGRHNPKRKECRRGVPFVIFVGVNRRNIGPPPTNLYESTLQSRGGMLFLNEVLIGSKRQGNEPGPDFASDRVLLSDASGG